MSEKGKAYLRTRWEYGERPVASAKMNGWDDRIAYALELAYRLINEAFGGGDGALGDALDGLQVVALTPPAPAVKVLPGYAFISGMPFAMEEAVELLPVVAPSADQRIDLVQARLSDWTYVIKEGEEDAAPPPPDADEDCLPLALLHLRVGMASIKNSDDGVNGYIEDARVLF
ncbi:MAG TPA: hypothetical protein ENN29_03335 [Candidatus Hydrogenedentes bacterium]|nr:hypothetical protein [Candidatus Hydrogenedentota bacterium]